MTPPDELKGFKLVLRSLRHRNYRLFFIAQTISLIGGWMTTVATSWLVYRLSGSPLLLGVVSFAGLFPAFLLAPVAGVLADRWNRHRIVGVTQALAMVQSCTLALLTLSGHITIGWIIALAFCQGLINAFDIPVRQAFVVELINDREDLSNAIALNSSVFNGARLIGPSIAGLIIATAGEGLCFLIDGISYLPVLIALAAMRVPVPAAPTTHPPVWHGVKEGMTYAFGFMPIRSILLLLWLLSLLGMPCLVLLPVVAREVLGGGPHTYGFLMAASGLGALGGALYLASRRTVRGLSLRIALMAGLFGAGLVVFAFSRLLWVSMALLVVMGFGMMVQMAASNTILQTIVEEDKRGRIMSLYTMSFMGAAPVGSLLAGAAAHRIGVSTTFIIGGVGCLAGAALFARHLPVIRKAIYPIYARMGIIPPTWLGLPEAAISQVPRDPL